MLGHRWPMAHLVRNAGEAEVIEIADLWHAGWHDAHAGIVPAELTRIRTRVSFVERAQRYRRNMRVAAAGGAVLGLCITKEDELFQLYVLPQARGTGLAQALLDDAERQLGAQGVASAWLACAVGNDRAAKFYEKCGWQRVRTGIEEMEMPDGPFPLEVWRYEKQLAI